MGGIAPGRTGRRCNSVLIGVRQPLNVFGIAAAAGAGVGSDDKTGVKGSSSS